MEELSKLERIELRSAKLRAEAKADAKADFNESEKVENEKIADVDAEAPENCENC